jgi:DNA polymerase II large subunit
MVEASEVFRKYIDSIQADVDAAYEIANKARAKGFDPDETVSIPQAKDLAERVEGITSVVAKQIKGSGVSSRIHELEEKYGLQDWRIAFSIGLEVAQQKFCKFEDEREAMEVGMRVAFIYITTGVVSSPIEGFIRLELKDRMDGKGKFFSLYFGGPIRSAGTTATCAFVAVADYIRMKMGYAEYDPTPDEIKRSSSEIDFFHERITNLQYHPSAEETEFLTKHLPVQIEGDPSEKLEAPNYKDLPRVSTNFMRNGYALAMAEGLALKTPKFWGKFSRWYKEFEMDHYSFCDDYVKLQKSIRSKGKKSKGADEEKVKPDFGFLKDLVAGRPIVGYPMRSGGFRLRYGRTRTSGFSVDALHPATMVVLDDFIAAGTQFRTERPGKSTTITTCDSIEGPTVRLKDGSVLYLDNEEKARKVNSQVEQIIYLGDVLINYGDFLDRAHILVPPGYCEEWWVREIEKSLLGNADEGDVAKEIPEEVKGFVEDFNKKISCKEAYEFSNKYNVPLHPRYTYYWKEVNVGEVKSLIDWVINSAIKDDKIIMPLDYKFKSELSEKNPKEVLEILAVPHKVVTNEYVVIEGDYADALKISLGIYSGGEIKEVPGEFENGLDYINKLSEIRLRDKSGLFVGMRMGRPEKGKQRKLIGSPHSLFPIGEEGGRMKCFQSALEKGKVNAEYSIYYCPHCEIETVYSRCHKCENKAEKRYWDYKEGLVESAEDGRPFKRMDLNIREYFDAALKKIGFRNYPEMIKGVRKTSNKEHIPENLVKGILRAKHNINVNKDGTTRFDMTEMTCTHFLPREAGTSVERLRELGYVKDVHGADLVSDDQVLELKSQDLILPACPDSLEEGADAILSRVAGFLDELLEKLYGLEPFYNIKKKKDLIGHLVIGLSPHTAAGIVARIIGFSKVQGMVAHPYLHSIMRRDCDGDEAGIMLLMDALLNFSPKLLSNHRGATQDEPLVLSSVLIPAEVDDMVFNMDIAWKYPIEFYEACEAYKFPWEIKIDIVNNHLMKESQFEGFGYTHPNTDFNNGVLCSSYKTIPTMEEKVMAQMFVAEKVRAVNADDVAKLTIDRHFMRDIKGNLRKFSQQQFRCVGCNEKFRRPPLKGYCTKCSGKIIFTISQGSIIKYMKPSMSLSKKYNLPPYLDQTLELLQQRIDLMFGKETEEQETMGKWFG